MSEHSESAPMPGIESYREEMHRLARARLARSRPGTSAVDPSDVVQQAMVRAQAGIVGFRGRSRGELGAWLRRIVERLVLDEFGRRSRRPEPGAAAGADESAPGIDHWLRSRDPSPSSDLKGRERAGELAKLLGGLPDDRREALERHYLRGESIEEVSRAMGRSTSSVAGLIRRALDEIRDRLAEDSRGLRP